MAGDKFSAGKYPNSHTQSFAAITCIIASKMLKLSTINMAARLVDWIFSIEADIPQVTPPRVLPSSRYVSSTICPIHLLDRLPFRGFIANRRFLSPISK